MTEYKPNCLKQNIRMLIENNHITQQKLANEIGMTQSNLSKALNEKEKRELTIEQLCSIAGYFGVSTDYILGIKDGGKNEWGGIRGFGAIVANLLEKREAALTTTKQNDVIHKTRYNYETEMNEEFEEVKPVEYLALFFPNYISDACILAIASELDEFCELSDKLKKDGYKSKWLPFNQFLSTYSEILKLYHSNKLSKDQFEYVRDGMINNLPDKAD